jgi:UDP-2-acetamido-2-deoxy-ribo-hexuluronate aminotransferase
MKIKTINLNKNYYIIKNNLKISLNKLFFKQKFILGNEVNILEKKLSTYLKVKYSLGVSSGSDALIVALLGCGIKKNDEVIIPDMTWISTASSIIFVGAKPVLADVNISDGTINIESLKNKITKKTKAIISVGLYGHLPQLDKLSKIAKNKNIYLINDGAQSFGSKYKDNFCHKYTTVSCTSFFPAKVLGSYGDAGACFTNNKNIYEKMKKIRAHGQSKKSYSTILGLNARIDTLQACVLNEKIKIISKEISRRSQILKIYHKSFSKNDKISFLKATDKCKANGSSVVLLLKNKKKFQKYMMKCGIETSNLYNFTISEQPVFKKFNNKKLYNSKIISKENVCLPVHPYMTDNQVNFVIKCVDKYFGKL